MCNCFLCEAKTSIRRAVATVVCSLFILSGSHALAQGSAQPAAAGLEKWQAGLDVLAAVALGDFATHVEGAGGVAVYLDRALRGSMFSLGGEFGYMMYGETSKTVPLVTLVPEVPDASIKVVSENQMLLLHARVRAQRQQGRWQPYADAQIGFTDLFTTTTVEGAIDCTYVPGGLSGSGYSSCSGTKIADTTNARDFVLSYGGSGGVMMRFRSSSRSPKLDLALRYHRGGHALYLTEGAIRPAGDGVVLDFSRSRTDMMLVYIGIVIGR